MTTVARRRATMVMRRWDGAGKVVAGGDHPEEVPPGAEVSRHAHNSKALFCHKLWSSKAAIKLSQFLDGMDTLLLWRVSSVCRSRWLSGWSADARWLISSWS